MIVMLMMVVKRRLIFDKGEVELYTKFHTPHHSQHHSPASHICASDCVLRRTSLRSYVRIIYLYLHTASKLHSDARMRAHLTNLL